MKNHFEALYQRHTELKARFQTAKAANDTEAMEHIPEHRL